MKKYSSTSDARSGIDEGEHQEDEVEDEDEDDDDDEEEEEGEDELISDHGDENKESMNTKKLKKTKWVFEHHQYNIYIM